MRRILIAAVVLPGLAMVGCGMIPKRNGPELTADQLGDPYAHGWSDADARMALWWTRNFPDDIAALGFALNQVGRYNKHDHRFGKNGSTHTSYDQGEKYGSFFRASADDVWALIDEPQLRVKMLSLEARERNRMRGRDRRRRTGAWPYDPSSAPEQPTPSRMDDTEVEQRLLERYR